MKLILKKIKYLSFLLITSPLAALAYNFEEESGLRKTAQKAGYEESMMNPENVIIKSIESVLAFVGVLFLILMIVGGLKWMTSLGNETEVKKAKALITQGVIGVLIIFSAYAITYFIVSIISSKTIS